MDAVAKLNQEERERKNEQFKEDFDFNDDSGAFLFRTDATRGCKELRGDKGQSPELTKKEDYRANHRPGLDDYGPPVEVDTMVKRKPDDVRDWDWIPHFEYRRMINSIRIIKNEETK